MSTLRILHLVDRLDRYGPGAWLGELTRHTPPETAIHEVLVYRTAGGKTIDWEGSATLNTLSGRWSWDPVALGRLARTVRRPWDVIHIWDEPSQRRQRRLGRRSTPLVDGAPQTGSFVGVRRQGPTRFLASHSGTIDELARHGFARDQIDLAPLGRTPPPPASHSREAVLGLLGWPATTRLIVAAGPLTRASRFGEAVWAYELVRLLHPDARLAIVGRGPDEQRLRRTIRLVSDPESVQVLDNDAMGQTVVALAEVYWQVDNGRWVPHELMGAMANGQCVVATDTPAHRRVITHEQTGYLVTPDSRSEIGYWTDRALSEPTLRETTGHNAADHIRNRFDPAAAAAQLCEIYRKVRMSSP